MAVYQNVFQSIFLGACLLAVASRDRKKSLSPKLCYYFNTRWRTTLRNVIFL